MKTIVLGNRTSEPTSLELENRALARSFGRDGMVLLENDGTLPIKKGPIALYGAGARMTVKGGRGSGEVRNRYSVSIEEGLINKGYEITTTEWLDEYDKFYGDTYEAYRLDMEERVKGLTDFHAIQKAMIPFTYPTGMKVENKHLTLCDTALYVIARQAGEGSDRENKEGDYQLSSVEKDNLEFISKHYKNFVVVINVGGLIDLSFLDSIHVSAIVFYGQAGEEGGNAFADLISGDYPFNGKLTLSWPKKYSDVPSSDVFSSYSYDKYDQDYIEGEYVGYRYYDAFGVEPLYPFGYGLSYTSFSIEYLGLKINGENISVNVKVTNTGEKEGKEVAQLYAELPNASYKRLVAFEKTKLLEEGESEVLSLTFTLKDIASYSEEKASWVLEEGEYILNLGSSSRDTSSVTRLTLSEEKTLEKCKNICPLEKEIEALVAPRKEGVVDSSLPSFSLDNVIINTVTHSYEEPKVEVEPLISEMSDEEIITLCLGASVNPKVLEVCAMGSSGNTTGELYEKYGIPNIVLSDGPSGLNLSPSIVILPDGRVKAARNKENEESYKRYFFGANRKALLYKMADPKDGTMSYQYATAWPSPLMLSQCFDRSVMERMGDAVGLEMEAFGVTIWLTPALNIVRNPLGGRTFEYLSEDPLLSGELAKCVVKGVQKHSGKGVSVKHYAANSSENFRNWSSSNMSEKVLREIYLRGFEIVVKDSKPLTVMASYNKVNGLHVVNNYDFLVSVLRNEWGFDGLVMSDWDSMKADKTNPELPLTGDVKKTFKAGLDLVCPGRDDQHLALLNGLKKGEVDRADLERAGERVIKLIRKNSVIASN